jgi:hypothetical protein
MSDDMCILYHLAPSDKKTMESKKEFVIAGYNLIESPIPQLVEEMSLLHPEVKFASPVSGKVTLVQRGERRKVLSIQVEADAEQQYAAFSKGVPADG